MLQHLYTFEVGKERLWETHVYTMKEEHDIMTREDFLGGGGGL